MLPFPPRVKAKDYLEINPLGTVPMLIDGDVTMTESCAIAHYFATKDGPTPLAVMPGEADYGAFLDYCYHSDATLTFPQTVYLRYAVMEKSRGFEAAGLAYAEWFDGRLPKVEARLADREFLCANRFTVADICVGYALILARSIGLDGAFSDRLRTYLAAITARPSYKGAVEREKIAAKAVRL
jgi:glutathione S-transferase